MTATNPSKPSVKALVNDHLLRDYIRLREALRAVTQQREATEKKLREAQKENGEHKKTFEEQNKIADELGKKLVLAETLLAQLAELQAEEETDDEDEDEDDEDDDGGVVTTEDYILEGSITDLQGREAYAEEF
ncbi:hypothetical protein BCR34DRAFT_587904 [Clohesyomyces aquaticus]|uniref:Uncharacterized protein n=1 Tax=Clohesyomyces aquaticus TaxID=1231657 RepID=A0A1Y1ZN18_9PLEO|nr:hypothetical protein BCR34DRAFT_587904 [Clohesyomyces aquaticus]